MNEGIFKLEKNGQAAISASNFKNARNFIYYNKLSVIKLALSNFMSDKNIIIKYLI